MREAYMPLRSPFLSRFAHALLSFVFACTWNIPAHAVDSAITDAAPTQHLFELMLVAPPSTTNDALTLLSMANIPAESLKVIGEDLQKANRLSQTSKSDKLTFVNGTVMLNGNSTGVEITSFAPVAIKISGHIWKYDKSLSADKNYVNLMQIVDGKAPHVSAGIMSLLIPSAEAGWERTKGTSIGAVVGGLVGFLIAALTFAALPETIFAAVVFAIIGGLWGLAKGGSNKKDHLNAAAQFIGEHGLSLVCDDAKVSVSSGQASLTIDRKSGSVSVKDKEGRDMGSRLDPALRKNLVSQAQSCKTQADAGRTESMINSAVHRVAGLDKSAPGTNENPGNPNGER
jgi:hypothetical protein